MSLRLQSGEETHVNAPKFFYRVERDYFLEKFVPEITLYGIRLVSCRRMSRCKSCLSAGWLCEPERPLIHQRVLDVEVFRIMEDSDRVIPRFCGLCRGLLGILAGNICGISVLCWRDWDGIEWDRRIGVCYPIAGLRSL